MDFGRTPAQIENTRKRLLIYAFVGLGGTFLFIFGTLSLIQNRTQLGSVLYLFLFVVALIALITKRLTEVQPISLFLALVLFVLASYLMLSGGAEGTGAYWTYSISMLMVLLVGPKIGSIYVVLYIAINTFLLLGPFPFVYQYTDLEAIRIITTSFTLFSMILASEWIRMNSYGAISKTYENHRQRANTDALTKLLNRHGLKMALEAKHKDQEKIVVVLDVDKFKSINDSYGHGFGDIVLKRLSKLLIDNTKGADLIARWGGEEFLIVLFDTTLGSAEALINRIKDEFGNLVFAVADTSVTVTFSAGISTFKRAADLDAVVECADKLLYKAKNSGRNRVVVEHCATKKYGDTSR